MEEQAALVGEAHGDHEEHRRRVLRHHSVALPPRLLDVCGLVVTFHNGSPVVEHEVQAVLSLEAQIVDQPMRVARHVRDLLEREREMAPRDDSLAGESRRSCRHHSAA